MFSAVGGGGSTSIVIAVSGDGAACAGWNINAGEADWGDQMLEIRSDYESYQGFTNRTVTPWLGSQNTKYTHQVRCVVRLQFHGFVSAHNRDRTSLQIFVLKMNEHLAQGWHLPP